MNNSAKGHFDVNVAPTHEGRSIGGVGRMSIDKKFYGDLEGESIGEMLSAGDPAKGSAGYVAIERVEGTLENKKGTFFLQHHATMDSGNHDLRVTIVPGSGTDGFVGIYGDLNIAIDAGGVHSYVLNYFMPD